MAIRSLEPGAGDGLHRDLVNIAELVTCHVPGLEGPIPPSRIADIEILHDAYLRIRDGRIADYGPMPDFSIDPRISREDLSGRTVLPGLVDPHTHLVFAGTREHELVDRISRSRNISSGQRMSGGINYTVTLTREASAEALLQQSLERLNRMLEHGTTTVEAKSGYGLNLEHELKLLEVAQAAHKRHPIDIVNTFMGAHAIPIERNKADYVQDVMAMIPEVAQRQLAEFCDVFCETGFFDVQDSRRILQTAHQHGLKLKIHADELDASGGSLLAGELNAISADHLQHATPESLAAMKAAGTIPVLLPGTAFYLGIPYANADNMRALDLPLALATDLNPGGCYCESQLFMAVLACTQMQILPLEAVVGITRNAAYAIDRGQVLGRIAMGCPADLVVLDAHSHSLIPYHFGVNLVHQVYKKGQACLIT